jgi:hypothetical protein
MNHLLGNNMQKHQKQRDLVRTRLGESRGKQADVRAVDASRLQVLVDEFLDALENDGPTSVDAELEKFKEATETEWQELARCADRIDDVDLETSWRDQATAVLGTLETGWREALYTQTDDKNRLSEILQSARDDDHETLARLDEVQQHGGFVAKFCFAGSPDALVAREVAEFCLLSTKGLSEIDQALTAHTTGNGDSDAALQELLGALQELLNAIDVDDDTDGDGDSQ